MRKLQSARGFTGSNTDVTESYLGYIQTLKNSN